MSAPQSCQHSTDKAPGITRFFVLNATCLRLCKIKHASQHPKCKEEATQGGQHMERHANMLRILIDSDWLANSHAPPPAIEAALPKGLPNLRRCQVWHKPFKANKAKQAWPNAQSSERLQSIPSKEFHVTLDGIVMSCISSNVLQFDPLHLCMHHDKHLCSQITAASPGGSLIHWTCGLWCLTSPE